MRGSTVANRGHPALMIGGELDMGSSAQVPAPWEDATTNGRTNVSSSLSRQLDSRPEPIGLPGAD